MSDGPLTVKAAVEAIDSQNRTARVIDEAGIFYPLKWTQGYLDEKMGKLKTGYYREFTIEKQGDDYKISSVKWIDTKDIPAWVGQRYKNQGHGGGGGRQYVPKNEKPVVFESVFKTCADLTENCCFDSYDQKVLEVWGKAKEISLEIIKESGC
jgi:hypothetical protein